MIADWTDKGPQSLLITADLGDMIAFTVTVEGRAWRGHRWVWREDGRILRETVIEDSDAPRAAPRLHAPLGELRAGAGQFAAGPQAILPPDFPAAARPLADRLHQAWNGRAFDLHRAEWLVDLVRALPDATFHFERAIVEEGRTALLWRMLGHGELGQRVRLIGSSVFAGAVEETVIDRAALAVLQATVPTIRYDD